MKVTFLLALGASALLGCGLDESGLAVDGGGDVSAGDAPADVQEEPYACNDDAGAPSCADAAAASFRSPALYASDTTTPCPSGFTSYDLKYAQHDPLCTCNCNTGTTPACDTSVAKYHTGLTDCSLGSGSLTTSCSGGFSIAFSGSYFQVDPPAVIDGCSGGTSVAPAVTTSDVRLCIPQCATDERVCQAQGSLKACIYIAGNVPSCPAEYSNGPFYVGDAPSVQCDGCSCVGTGDCTGSTLHLYTSNNCGAGDHSYKMDGTCNAATLGITGMSAKIDPNLKGGTYQCKITQGGAHTSYGGNAFTVCCQ
jgi:hypothetical protein